VEPRIVLGEPDRRAKAESAHDLVDLVGVAVTVQVELPVAGKVAGETRAREASDPAGGVRDTITDERAMCPDRRAPVPRNLRTAGGGHFGRDRHRGDIDEHREVVAAHVQLAAVWRGGDVLVRAEGQDEVLASVERL